VDCAEARSLLALYLDGELDSPRAVALEQHVAGCVGCAALLAREKSLRDALRSHAPYHLAPQSLRERIAAQTAQSLSSTPVPESSRKATPGRWQRWALPVAASLALATVLNTGLRYQQAGNRLADEVTDAHVRSLMVDHLADVPSTDQHTVKPWFADKLDFSPPVHDLVTEGYPLTGGRLEYIDHHAAAALIYRHRLHVINLFVWPSHATLSQGPAQQTREGFNLVHWRSGGMDFWAVSDLNPSELEEFAQLVQKESI
jgi:anti-sigma factor (TIGR02949 family)